MHHNIDRELLSGQFDPVFFRLKNPGEKESYYSLLSSNPTLIIIDEIQSQLRELIKSVNPALKIATDDYPGLIRAHVNDVELNEYGVWVYFPWRNTLVHLLDEDEFVEVRTNRNRYKISREEQEILKTKKIGIIGLSVGQSIALTLAQERVCGELRLADFDIVELSNLNRIRTGLHNLGVNKAVLAAREIKELDPFVKISVFDDGISPENIGDFLSGDGRVDVLVEVCDSVDVKVLSRIKARELKIPVVMDTNDRGMLDVERFDLEPVRPLFHGLAGDIEHTNLEKLSPEARMGMVMKIVGAETLSERMKASMLEMNISINTWPQLASSVVLGGAITTDICRRMLLGDHMASGRFYVDLEQIIPSHETANDANEKIDGIGQQGIVAGAISAYFKKKSEHNFSISAAELNKLADAAANAPSIDNIPCSLSYVNGVLFVIQLRPDNSWSDSGGAATNAGLGIILENIRLQASALGLVATCELFPLGYNSLPAAVRLSKGGAVADQESLKLASGIYKRQIPCQSPVKREIPLDFYQQVHYFVGRNNNLSYKLLDENEDITGIADIIGSFQKARILSEKGYREFFNMVALAEQNMEDLSYSAAEQAVYAMLREKKVANLLAGWGKGDAIKFAAAASAQLAFAYVVVMAENAGAEDMVETGRTLEKICIEANLAGVAVQLYNIPALIKENKETDKNYEIEIKKLRERFLKIFPLTGEYKRDYTEVFLMKLSATNEGSYSDVLKKPGHEILLEIK
ncbi:MAG TPA: Rv1355c family protein [Flavipsychrobacter sp.]|nr:Rv1355c family protein [Flavipsychrobacter sp.]